MEECNGEELLICRCEGVYLKEILQSIKEGASSIQGIKKRVRVGMGHCQGRTCQPVVREILQTQIGPISIEQLQKAQSPVRPIPFRKLNK